MPTIDQLPAAAAVADGDELPVSQSGVAHRATRAQVVAGLQTALALTQGQLLGRNSTGTGTPEAVNLGANLSLAGGTLSASVTPLNFSALPTGAVPSGADLTALGQGGRSVGLPYAQFMAGLAGLSGIDLSALSVTPTGASTARHLADIAADAVPIEAFGAHGDGVTDDSAALSAAIASGRPVRLGPKTYVVNGQFTIAQPGVTLLGVPGATTLRRLMQSGSGAWIAVQADKFRADGVIFDANSASVTTESWGVLVTNACTHSDFSRCAFLNAVGPTLGCGLVFGASDPAVTEHVVHDCEFAGNAAHGLWVQACSGVLVADCRAHDNAQYGIVADFNDPAFVQKVRLGQLLGNRCWNNTRGIAVGNYNATNTSPALWGNANPDALSMLVAGNVCHDNINYGIAVSGWALLVQGNVLSNNGVAAPGGAGMLANVSNTRVAGNVISGASTYGIDCGGSLNADIAGNYVSGAVLGINCGGGTDVRVDANTLQDCTSWAINVNNVETDGSGVSFNVACGNLAITGNWIGMNTPSAGGILLRDGPVGVLVARNNFVGTGNVANCLWANTDSVLVEGNRFNFSPRFIANPSANGALQQVVFPDIADVIMITSAPSGVQSMISSYQAQTAGQLSFVRVTSGGSGYTTATVTIGGAGSGATAKAMLSGGAVIGVMVTAPGSGYGAIGATVPVAITGDGSGAAAIGYAAPPLPEERRLLVRCNGSVKFTRSGSAPVQENWTAADITVPANSDVEWAVSYGEWRAGRFPYLSPTVLSGTGSPAGLVSAAPGSTYQNLSGGVGASFWVKQTGTAASGWVAVA